MTDKDKLEEKYDDEVYEFLKQIATTHNPTCSGWKEAAMDLLILRNRISAATMADLDKRAQGICDPDRFGRMSYRYHSSGRVLR